MSPPSAGSSPSCPRSSTASRSIISTTAPRRRRPMRCSTRCAPTRRPAAPTCCAASIAWPSGRPRPTRMRASRWRRSSASQPMEIVFTGGCTAAINLVAYSYGSLLKPGDRILLSELEHHSNIVPWQLLRDAQRRRARHGAGDGRRPHRPRGIAAFADAEDQAGLARPCLQRHRRAARYPRRRRAGEDGRRQGDAGRRPARAARAARPAGARHRFLRLRRPQGLWPQRRRRAVGQARTARRDAAVPWRRLDDRPRDLGRDDLGAAAAPLRGRHAADRAGDRPGRGLQMDARARLDARHMRTRWRWCSG